LIHDALAIALSVTRVVVGMVGMPTDIRPVGQARIEIAHAFGIGEIVDALADPCRAGDVAAELAQAAKYAVPLDVDPQVPGGSSAIALPSRRIGGVASDEPRSSRAEGKVIHLSVGQLLRHPAFETQHECLV